MRNRRFASCLRPAPWLLVPPLLAGVLAAPASVMTAQTVGMATGAIIGTVTDRTGATLAGVEVTLTGDALMGALTTVTGAEGRFHFPALPPGDYSVVSERAGFHTARRHGVHVGLGFTATVNETLDVAGPQDTLTVRPSPPVIDTQSTSLTTTFESEHLADLPGARSMSAILAATPAVQVGRFDVGGSSAVTGTPYAAYGTSGYNRPTLEGINVTGIAATGLTLDYGSFEEVSVGTGSYGPEWPAPGVRMQFITKSGGNQYRGTLYADYEHGDWQSFNVDEDQIAGGAPGSDELAPREANRLSSYHDVNLDIGGFIERDRLWWYSSFRDQDVAARYVNFAAKPHRTRVTNYSGKATYQLTRRNRLVAFGQLGRNFEPNRLDSFGAGLGATTAIYPTENSTSEQRALSWVWKGEWTGVLSDRLIVEARAGQFAANLPAVPNGTGPRLEDIGSLVVEGRSRDWTQALRRSQLQATSSYFRDGRSGSHHFKLGGELLRTTESVAWNEGYSDDALHLLQNGRPLEVYLFETPSESVSGLWVASAWAGDSWRPHARLTLNLGLRFDRYQIFLPEQSHQAGRFTPEALAFDEVDNLIAWNVVAPRFGATVDLSGDGKTVAKLSVGRYWLAPGTVVGSNANPNATEWWRRYSWVDRNQNGRWDEGEEVGLPIESRGGAALESVDPALRLPRVNEVAAWIERDLPAHVALRTGVVWREMRQPYMRQNPNRPFDAFTIPVTLRDPGPDGRVGTADDGAAIQAYNLDPSRLDLPLAFVVGNVPNASSDHVTWELTAARRFSGRWSMMTGFSYTWSGDQASGYSGQRVRSNVYPATPNDLINAEPDGRHRFETWTFKVHGTVEGPWGVRISPLLRHQSGQPYGRTFQTAPNALNYDRIRVPAEPIGTRRMDHVTILDVRVEKGFRLPPAQRVAAFLDVYNLLNANPEQNISWLSGPTFLRPLSIVPPRIARIGVKVEW